MEAGADRPGVQELLEEYGVDATRWHLLATATREGRHRRDDSGIRAAWRFAQRLWRLVGLVSQIPAGPAAGSADDCLATALRRTVHRLLAAIGYDLDRSRFDLAIAHMHELLNRLDVALKHPECSFELCAALKEGSGILVQVAYPIMPHLAEQCWQALAKSTILAETNWPEPDKALLSKTEVAITVHVNGRRRDEILVPKGTAKGVLEEAVLRLKGVNRALDGKSVRRIILVPDRTVNVVS